MRFDRVFEVFFLIAGMVIIGSFAVLVVRFVFMGGC